MARVVYQSLLLHNNIRIYCWQNEKFDLYDRICNQLDEIIDTFVKHHGKVKITDQHNLIKLKNMSKSAIVHSLNNGILFFEKEIYKYIDEDTDQELIQQTQTLVGYLKHVLETINPP